jgi:hypothetical protein
MRQVLRDDFGPACQHELRFPSGNLDGDKPTTMLAPVGGFAHYVHDSNFSCVVNDGFHYSTRPFRDGK